MNQESAGVRRRELFVWDWKFHKGDVSGPEMPGFDDGGWRTVDLPHDWSIEGPWAEDEPTGGAGGYLPTGIGWYRKSFVVPASQRGKRFLIEFDGVYMNSEVWINGRPLGKWPFGYSSFAYDLTEHLRFGEANVIAVRVDNSGQRNSRWYSGSGIFRNVWLTSTEAVRVAHWGTYVTTPKVSSEAATVRVRTRVANDGDDAARVTVTLTTQVVDAGGAVVATAESQAAIDAGGVEEVDQSVEVDRPALWSLESPVMYTVRSIVRAGGRVLDEYETPIGIREIAYDVDKGFLLNGKPVKQQGMCLHHDAGNLGAAVPEAVWERRLKILKEMGCNAIRTSHNPPDPVLLDLCDRMGFMVQNEAFDEWLVQKPQVNGESYCRFFNEWYEKDLISFIRRDRNHPCVVMWSAGNEIGEQRTSDGHEVLKKLVEVFHREDPTRPVTVGMDNIFNNHGEAPVAFTELQDVVGYNYVDRWGDRRERYYDADRRRYPERKFVGTESCTVRGIRGLYELPGGAAPITYKDERYRGEYTSYMIRVEAMWKYIKLHDFVVGDFGWTGIDYLGETSWPRKGAASGQIDTAGFKKDAFYCYQAMWTDRPMVHLLPHWNWEGNEGRVIPVVAFTNCDTVELIVNGKSFGRKSLRFPRDGNVKDWNTYTRPVVPVCTTDLHLSWDVPYEAGTLQAIGWRDGVRVCETMVRTAGAPAELRLSADREWIKADGRDVVHYTVDVVDASGVTVPDAEPLIRFELSGPGRLLATDNGDLSDLSPPTATERKAFHALALAVVQSTRERGVVRMRVSAEGLKGATVEVRLSE